MDIDYGSQALVGFFENPDGGLVDRNPMTYQEATDYYLALYNQDLSDVMTQSEYNDYVHQSDMYKSYGDTDGITDRMKDLALKITAGADNDYDKARLIEQYLRQYTYSTKAVGGHNPDSDMSTPEGMADIADRFLFETESGYCVHYTSSMVMLLRAAGIPARAMNGYRYSFPFEVQEKYVVEANCAHVWPEAYIQNVGWLPFEPTSAYTTAADYNWHRSEAVGEQSDTEKLNEISKLPDIPESDEANEDYQNEGVQLVKIIGIVLFSIALLILIIWVGAILLRRIIYKLASPEKKIKLDVATTKARLIKESGDEFKDRGLLSDYLKLAPEEERDEIKKLFDLYYKIVYGND